MGMAASCVAASAARCICVCQPHVEDERVLERERRGRGAVIINSHPRVIYLFADFMRMSC